MTKVVVGILKRNGKILMGQRPLHKPFPSAWEFPGGKVESGESLIDALRRELREELSLDVISAENCFREQVVYGPQMEYDITYFLIEDFLGEITNNDFRAIGWFNIAELRKLEHLSGNQRLLELIYSGALSVE